MSSSIRTIQKNQTKKEYLMWELTAPKTWTLAIPDSEKKLQVKFNDTLNQITGAVISEHGTSIKYKYEPKHPNKRKPLIKKTMMKLVRNHA